MDDMDRAQEINEQFQDDMLANHRRRASVGESREICLDCEEPIPAARRAAVPGCQRCTSCQEHKELLAHWR